MWLNADTRHLRLDLVAPDIQRVIRLAIVEGDEKAARWLDSQPMLPSERLMALLIACDLVNIVQRLAARQDAAEALDEDYAAWCDQLYTEPELCDCGLPMDAHGNPDPECQCCAGCGHYPCCCPYQDAHWCYGCGTELGQGDCCECREEHRYQRADAAYETWQETRAER